MSGLQTGVVVLVLDRTLFRVFACSVPVSICALRLHRAATALTPFAFMPRRRRHDHHGSTSSGIWVPTAEKPGSLAEPSAPSVCDRVALGHDNSGRGS